MTDPSFGLFALFAIFDVVAEFAVYVICMQIVGHPIEDTLWEDVIHYTFKSSLFDCVAIAALRTFILLFSHFLYRSTSSKAVALTTLITTVFTIVKVFLYSYPYSGNQSLFLYVLHTILIP